MRSSTAWSLVFKGPVSGLQETEDWTETGLIKDRTGRQSSPICIAVPVLVLENVKKDRTEWDQSGPVHQGPVWTGPKPVLMGSKHCTQYILSNLCD